MNQYQGMDQTSADQPSARERATGLDEPRAGAAAHASPRLPARIGIMGANVTGIAIARSLLAAHIPVTLFDGARGPLDEATAAMRSDYEEAIGAGKLTAAQRDRRVALLAATVNLHHLKDCDVIVDALCIDAAAREAVQRRLNEVARPDAVLLTGGLNGDTGDIGHTGHIGAVDRIAALARFPANVAGFRLSHGSGGWQAWELVPGKATSRQALAIATRLVASLGMESASALPPATSLA